VYISLLQTVALYCLRISLACWSATQDVRHITINLKRVIKCELQVSITNLHCNAL